MCPGVSWGILGVPWGNKTDPSGAKRRSCKQLDWNVNNMASK